MRILQRLLSQKMRSVRGDGIKSIKIVLYDVMDVFIERKRCILLNEWRKGEIT